MQYVGLDFGTTNSALAVTSEEGEVALAEFSFLGENTSAFRSVLFFPEDRSLAAESFFDGLAGPRALETYLEEGGEGRIILSPKMSLASSLFEERIATKFTKDTKEEEETSAGPQ